MDELLKMLNATKDTQSFFVFFIPGFISLLVSGTIGPVPESDFAKRVVAAVGYSALNFMAMSAVIGALDFLGLGATDSILRALFLYVFPFLYPFLIFRMREKQVFGFSTPFPSVWDQFFARRDRQYYVRAYLKGDKGEYILGRYGAMSMASQSPADEKLLLEQVYDDDGSGNWLVRPDTVAFLLPMSECRWIEFINNGEYQNERQAQEQRIAAAASAASHSSP